MLETHSPSLANSPGTHDHDQTIREVKDRICSILSPQDQTTLSDHAKLIESFIKDLKAEEINTFLLDPEDMKLPILARSDKRREEAYGHFLASQTDFAVRYKRLLRDIQGFPELESILKAELEDILVAYGDDDRWYKNFKLSINLASTNPLKNFASKIRGRTKLKLILPQDFSQRKDEIISTIFPNISHLKSLEIIPEWLQFGHINSLECIFAHTPQLRVLGLTSMHWENIPLEEITPINPSGTLRHLELSKCPLYDLETEKIKKIFAGCHKVHTLGLASYLGMEDMTGKNLLEFFSQFPNLIRISMYGDLGLPKLFELFQSRKNELQAVLKNVHILSCSGELGYSNQQELDLFTSCFPNLKKIVGKVPEGKVKKIYAQRA